VPINNIVDSLKSAGRVIALSNLTTGAIWEPLSFRLDRSTGLVSSLRAEPISSHGIGANVIELSGGTLSRRILAIYKISDEWMLFDGKHEHPLKNVTLAWTRGLRIIPGFLCLAKLTLYCNGTSTEITYFRPSFRHWFEGGWTLDDIDIGNYIFCLGANPAARMRLDAALKVRKNG